MSAEITPQPTRIDTVRLALDQLRKKLLDLTGRNPLLNYKHAAKARQVRFVDASIDGIFSELTSGGKHIIAPMPDIHAMEDTTLPQGDVASIQDELHIGSGVDELTLFQAERSTPSTGLPKAQSRAHSQRPEDRANEGDLYILPVNLPQANGQRRPNLLNTSILPLALDRTLSKIYSDTKTAEQEYGFSTLFVALGFLEWYESDSSDRRFLSPLLLVPVQMDRSVKNSQYQYGLAGRDDEAETNITLAKRLHDDFGIPLPTLRPEGTAAEYFTEVASAIRHRERWSIIPYATLGNFNFSRLALYKDLEPGDSETLSPVENHNIVSALLAGTNQRDELAVRPFESTEHEALQLSLTPTLITDADSSQYAAIIDASKGRNMVIEGPPGTGKSQTITNIIAAALGAGKTVLFVAEKAAALNVVKARLENAGLGDFCLELHSTKASKADVFEALRRRYYQQAAVSSNPSRSLELAQREAGIVEAYSTDLHSLHSGLELPVFDLVWRQERLRIDLGDVGAKRLELVRVPNADSLTEVDLANLADIVLGWAARRDGLLHGRSSLESHPLARLHATNSLEHEEGRLALQLAVDNFVFSVERATSMLLPVFERYPTLRDAFLTKLERYAPFLAEVSVFTAPSSEAMRDAFSLDDSAQALPQIENILAVIAESTLLGQEVIAAVNDCVEQCQAFMAAFDATELPDVTTSRSLYEAFIASQARENELKQLEELSKRLATLFDTAEPDQSFFNAADSGLKIISDMSREEIYRRHQPAIDPVNLATLRNITEHISDLSTRTDVAEQDFAFDEIPNAKAVRDDARICGSSGMFPGLNRSFVAARKRIRAFKISNSRWTPAEASQRLENLAALLEDWNAFENDADARRILGPCFNGRKTEKSAVIRLLELNRRLDDELASKGRHGSAFQAFIQKAPVKSIDEFREIAASTNYSELRNACEQRAGDLETVRRKCTAVTAARSLAGNIWPADQRLGAETVGTIRSSLATLDKAADLLRTVSRSKLVYIVNAESVEAFLRSDTSQISDVGNALRYIELVRRYHDASNIDLAIKLVPEDVVAGAAEAHKDVTDSVTILRSAITSLSAREEVDLQGLEKSSLAKLADDFSQLRDGLRGLDEWLAFKAQEQRLTSNGLKSFADAAIGVAPAIDLRKALEFVLIRSAVAVAQSSSVALSETTGVALNAARSRFAEQDLQLLRNQRVALRNKLLRCNMPDGNGEGLKSTWTEGSLLRLEMGKQKRHPSLRILLSRAGEAVKRLKPCFMMSPLSVAQYLPPNGDKFDLVVIDEASQMRPEDALSAVARGRQLIVVGDPKQLPPSDFFRTAEAISDDEDEDAVEAESILDFASQQFDRPRRLLWHYRSRHPGLIAFSNRHFYDNSLLLFPAPHANLRDAILSVYVGGAYNSSLNPAEADRVVEAAREHMVLRPEMSIAIVTMNKPQQELIDMRLQQLEKIDPRVGAYFQRWSGSGQDFIIKNLETVQGDERDLIMISTVYGPDENSGRVMQRFGPIAGRSGWRRLNVLFTRAKRRVELYTSLRPSDIIVDGDRTSRGVRALRDYLEYASIGSLPQGTVSVREPDSDFEISVAAALHSHGFEIEPQVGVAGFFIDLAVADPANRSQYLVGIECDGRAFHSSKSARDRDRIREDVLKGMGWTLLRVWSTDWFANPRHETTRLVTAINAIISSRQSA